VAGAGGVTFAVCVLWRPGNPQRERLWDYCRARWETAGFTPITAAGQGGLWAARNEAAAKAGEWDAAIFADADMTLAEPEQAWAALEQAAAGRRYVAAFTTLDALGPESTVTVLEGASFDGIEPLQRYHGSWVGAYAIGRSLWNELGGYDERFAPFSGQDVAIIHAAATLGVLERIPGTAYHLWHERGGEQLGHLPSHPSLGARYEAATGDAAAMRELLKR
jgi:hypothetical protein